MTKESLERAKQLEHRSKMLSGQLKELRKLERESVPFALCSQITERAILLDDLPKDTQNAVIDLLVGAFSREIAKAEDELAAM